MNLHFTSFSNRILFILMCTVLVSQILMFFLFNYIATKNAYLLIRDNLQTTSHYFKDIIENQFQNLESNANLLVGDFAFKKAIATQDVNTIRSALLNHQRRINSDIMISFNSTGDFIALSLSEAHKKDTSHINKENIERIFQGFINDLKEKRQASIHAVVYLHDTAYQIALLPIQAPHAFAYVAIGYAIDDDIAAEIQEISSSNITFLLAAASSHPEEFKDAQIVGSTVNDFGQDELLQLSKFKMHDNQITLQRSSGKIVSQIVLLQQANKNLNFYAVIQIPLEDVLKKYLRYRPYISILTLLLLIAAIPVARFVASRTTRPLEALARATESVENGDYTNFVNIPQRDEIGLLSDRLNKMIEGLAEREKMKYMAFHDSLTRLPNRRMFFTQLDEAIENKRSSALIMLDLDGFKAINDKYGHDAGDATLKEVAKRLKSFVLREDDIVARLGGDEFTMLLHNCSNIEVMTRKASSIIKMIAEPICFNNNEFHVSASIGISFLTDNMNRKEWLKSADETCYKAKVSGKNTFNFANKH